MNSSSGPSWAVVVAFVLWFAVGVLTLASWLTWMGGAASPLPQLLGLTAASAVGPATVAHVSLYAVRTYALIRVTGGLERPDASLHPIR